MAETEAVSTHFNFSNITDIANFAEKMKDADEAAEFIKAEASKLSAPISEDLLNGLIEAVRRGIKDGCEKTEEEYLKCLQETVTFNIKTRLPDAKKFIEDNMLDEDPDFVEAFIYNSANIFFGFNKTDINNIIKFYNRVKKEHDNRAARAEAENRYSIDSKYEGMYTLYVNNNGDKRLRINPHPDKIADLIIEENSIISYREALFIYRDGFYRNEPETVEDKIVQVLNEICKGDNSDNMHKKKADILTQIKMKTREHDYPFNDYKTALPVENGVVIFDFESGTCELIDHDPENYKFNYMLPVRFDPAIRNTVIYDILKGYTENLIELIQIPAQAFMQAMGHGPYKRAYLIYGEKNSGKTTFIELLEYLVGGDGFCDVSLDKLNQRFQIASLEGKLLNMHDDMGFFTLSDTGIFKTLTGRRKHDVERKGIQPYTATLDCAHVFTTNMPAKFDSRVKADGAFWERWSFITFDKTFRIKGNFKAEVFTPENMTAFLNIIIDEMLKIGKNCKLSTDVDWYETRERWMLAGNPLYKMVTELMDREIRGSKGTSIIKEELLKILRDWCLDKGIDDRAIPDSLKDLASLAEACGWDEGEKPFKGYEVDRKKCYVIPYKWKPTIEVFKYSSKVSTVASKQNTLD